VAHAIASGKRDALENPHSIDGFRDTRDQAILHTDRIIDRGRRRRRPGHHCDDQRSNLRISHDKLSPVIAGRTA
jgi:hypothetical protein